MYTFTKTELAVFNKLTTINGWSIVGAKALSYHGVHRYTSDTDILCHTSVAKQVLQVLKSNGFSIEMCDESQAKATKGTEEFDVLITSAPEYSNALVQSNNYYTTASGLLDMYLLSDKEQNQYDAVNLIKTTGAEPSDLVLELERDRYTYYLAESKKDIKSFRPRLLEDEFDLESLLLELDDFE